MRPFVLIFIRELPTSPSTSLVDHTFEDYFSQLQAVRTSNIVRENTLKANYKLYEI